MPAPSYSIVALCVAVNLTTWSRASIAAQGPTAASANANAAVVGSDFEALANVPQVLGALMVVLAVVLGLAWFAKRVLRVPTRNDGVIRVVAGLALGPRERLLLVNVGSEQVLLGLAPGRIETLHVLDEPVVSEASERTDFADLMKRGWRRTGNDDSPQRERAPSADSQHRDLEPGAS